jgi:enamine deaminase RidA (YjgF/YER057c/UK114 family)
VVGYSRAVRRGNMIFVSGTSDLSSESILSQPNAAYLQAKGAIEIIEKSLRELGASLSDVTRTRVYVREDVDWRQVATAHREAFAKILPASTMLVGSFLDKRVLVEIEADALSDKFESEK